MKPIHILVLSLALTGCQCGTELPTPVTLRLHNDTSQAIYVDASAGKQGLSLQRKQGEAWGPFSEELGCECQSCDRQCDSDCECPAVAPVAPMVLKVLPGTTVERTWKGFVHTQRTASACGILPDDSGSCLEEEIPPLDEPFQVQLCYALSVPGLGPTDGSAPVPGVFPVESQICVQQQFLIADGQAEIRPQPPAACTQDSECTAPALCLDGVCTTTCPANTFPAVGGAWQVRVLDPEEQGVPGFFSRSTGAGGRRILTGTGTLTSVRYSNGTMTIQLARPAAPSGEFKASLSVSLPPEAAVALNVGEALSVRVVDVSTSSLPENRALTIRDASRALLLAADPGQLGAALTAEDTSPFTVASLPGAVGCEDTPCGKRAFQRTEFRAGTSLVALKPGESKEVVAASATWLVLNLSNSVYRSTSCTLKSQLPYVLLNRRSPQGP
ncbi:hypothetical protein [Hyalangium sp.]|uniref:hypothetical protein n=1 Tax=Hyalangium sp. TaxID=2028555 RepID=UPI002D3A5006|nr:hypothetical protein [Hyalangium sp.]HYI01345.1 hypothetical protein [Hyalangium sp.]